jgi:YHS domain-containing protein
MRTLNKYNKVLLICSLVLVLFTFIGCKKKSEPTTKAPVEVEETVESVSEQKTCPVMGGAINKDLYVEYRGEKVYFCCKGCEKTFLDNPEKYLSKLPQFND